MKKIILSPAVIIGLPAMIAFAQRFLSDLQCVVIFALKSVILMNDALHSYLPAGVLSSRTKKMIIEVQILNNQNLDNFFVVNGAAC